MNARQFFHAGESRAITAMMGFDRGSITLNIIVHSPAPSILAGSDKLCGCRTTGDAWCYEYKLKDLGILASPIIEIYE